MKRKIGIALVTIINCINLYLIIYAAILAFGLVVAPLGEIRGKIVSHDITGDIFIFTLISLSITLVLNIFIFKKLIKPNRSILLSFVLIIIEIIIFLSLYLSALNSFINYQKSTTILSHFLDKKSITNIKIIKSEDTTKINNISPFLNEIGTAKYKRGVWKYQKKYKILLTHNNGDKDSILSNGEIFGPYQGRYFFSDSNVVENYIRKPFEFDTLKSDIFEIAKFDLVDDWLQRIFVVIPKEKTTDTLLIKDIICKLKAKYPLTNKSHISFFTEVKYADNKENLFEKDSLFYDEVYETWLNSYYLSEYEFSTREYTTYPTSSLHKRNVYLLNENCR